MKTERPTENQLYVLEKLSHKKICFGAFQRLSHKKVSLGRVLEWNAFDFPTVTLNACIKRGWVQKDAHGKLSLATAGYDVLEAQKS